VLVVVYLYAVSVVLSFGVSWTCEPAPGRGVLKCQVAGSVVKSGGW
jgi:hypothetical protein